MVYFKMPNQSSPTERRRQFCPWHRDERVLGFSLKELSALCCLVVIGTQPCALQQGQSWRNLYFKQCVFPCQLRWKCKTLSRLPARESGPETCLFITLQIWLVRKVFRRQVAHAYVDHLGSVTLSANFKYRCRWLFYWQILSLFWGEGGWMICTISSP